MCEKNSLTIIVRAGLAGMLVLLAGLAACSSAQPVLAPGETPNSTIPGPVAPLETAPPDVTVTQPAATAPDPLPTAAAPVQPAPPAAPVVGIEMHRIDAAGGLELVQQAGTYWVRRNALLWSSIEPEKGQRNWEAVAGLESELQNAASQGLQVILIVRSTPAWAQQIPGVLCGPVRQDQLEAFAGFLHDVVARYSQPPYNVKYWELGNEPDIDPALVTPENIFGCWGDLDDPYYGGGDYAEMLQAVYPQIKAADPQAQVVVGGLLMDCDPVNPPLTAAGAPMYCDPSLFLEGILKNGGGAYFDVVSYHAYDFYGGSLGVYGVSNWRSSSATTGPVLIAKARYLKSLLAAYGVPEKRLMNTENAILCAGKEETCQAEDFVLTKAYYLAQANISALAEGLQANVWYSITGWRYSELVTRDLQPLPVYNALQFNARQLDGTAYVGDINQFAGVKGYALDQAGKRIWFLWSLDGDAHPIQLDALPAGIYDVFGAALPLEQQLNITPAPVYIEWEP